MPEIVDQLIGDPADFAPGRVELDFGGAGLSVIGADWGEAAVETAMVRQELGELVSDRHLPNREPVLKLRVSGEGETNLATVAARLQAQVGIWQREGGWLQRNFKVGGGKFGSLACQVKKASLADFAGWQRGDSPDVTLALVTGPLWYATAEDVSAVFKEESARELVFELAKIAGSAPGLIRVRVTNNNTEGDWRGLIFAGESRDHPQDATKDTTAALAYNASALTLKGGSEVKEVGGVKVVEHASLTAGWLTILNSEIAGVGHMTHKGVRRLWIRAEDLGVAAGDVELKLRWRALGSLSWSENAIVPSPLVDAYQWLDMGECRPEAATLGDERWEWELQARAPSGAGKVRVHRVVPAPTEQYLKLSAPDVSQGADAQSQKSPGTVKGGSSGVEWVNPENAKVADETYATCTPTGIYEFSKFLEAKKCLFAIPEDANVAGVVVGFRRKTSVGKCQDSQVKLLGITGAGDRSKFEVWSTSLGWVYFGGGNDLWGAPSITPAQVNLEAFGVELKAYFPSVETASVDAISITVYYTEASDPNRICFATRSAELRSDGVARQHPKDDVWGRVVPDGFLPVALPSGLEGRAFRAILIPTQGDLDTLADSGSNKLSAEAYIRAGYAFAREAT